MQRTSFHLIFEAIKGTVSKPSVLMEAKSRHDATGNAQRKIQGIFHLKPRPTSSPGRALGSVVSPLPIATEPTSFERPVTYPLHSEDTLTAFGILTFEVLAKYIGYGAGGLMIMFLSAHGYDIYLDIARHF